MELNKDLRVRVDAGTRETLEKLAEQQYVTVAALIRKFIREGIAREDST